MRTTPARIRALSAAIGCLVLLCAGCSSSPARQQVSEDVHLHSLLPASVRSTGRLLVVTDASYAPASSFAANGRTIIGFEPDLGAALGQVLGVRVIFHNADFAALPSIIAAGHADMIMSAMTDTVGRESRLTFVDYFSAGTSIVVQRGDPHAISDLSSLCGQKVAVENGTVQAELLAGQQQHCGNTPIRLVRAKTNDDALLLLRTGQADAVPMDYPPAELLTTSARSSGEYQLASTNQYEPGLYGIGVAKNASSLAAALRGALNRLIADGRYRQILAKWNVRSGAVRASTIDAAGNSTGNN